MWPSASFSFANISASVCSPSSHPLPPHSHPCNTPLASAYPLLYTPCALHRVTDVHFLTSQLQHFWRNMCIARTVCIAQQSCIAQHIRTYMWQRSCDERRSAVRSLSVSVLIAVIAITHDALVILSCMQLPCPVYLPCAVGFGVLHTGLHMLHVRLLRRY